MELGVERSQRSVGLIDRADVALQLEFTAGGKIGGDGDRKLRGQGNVRRGDVNVIVGAVLLRIRRADNDAAVTELDFLYGEFRRGLAGPGDFAGGPPGEGSFVFAGVGDFSAEAPSEE